ncbi:flagellar basal body P-ring formation chaperone FlgA [Sporolituus thermophilus]|uniref:Flagella basal body P-ring formation protein FlgA n=1 Tax=Sporolituus thermophilus DSM 23256 TaxID=1123285 RepID=A0A1G7HGC4_9FIRM|nr:flagellar basal body P-ring formation chaperone FlgA [Sporolituus thermophilus]SDE99386.1 flagella basal body P-ring formation protein FlgA [Sporolituus thermophilus DSM 23256]
MLRKVAVLLALCLLAVALSAPIAAATAAGQVVAGAELADAAARAAKQRLAGVDGEVTVSLDAAPTDLVVPAGELKLTVEFPYGIRFSGLTAAVVNVQVDGRHVATATVKLDIKLYREVLVAARPIAAREIITADSLRRERRDVGRLAPGYITDERQVLGLAARRALAPGAVITDSALTKPILIRRGQFIAIIARGGGIEAVAAGQALQDGAEGQVIRVQNIQSKKILSAQVLDDASALVLTYRGK